MDARPPIGIIAGQGRLPVLIAEGIRAAGRQVACVGFAGYYDDDLPEHCDHFDKTGVIRIGRWIKLLRRWGVEEAVLVGKVKKERMDVPLRWFRQIPDWRSLKLWYGVGKKDRRSATMLAALADELSREGIELIDTTRYIPDELADEGVMTKVSPSDEHFADVAFAWPIVRELNRLDIGQGVAVKDREIIAVEAIEGTDAMIKRAGDLCRMGGWTMIKTAKVHQDMRLDVPTVGPTTLEAMHAANGRCLVLETGKVIVAEKAAFLKLADRLKIAVVGRGD